MGAYHGQFRALYKVRWHRRRNNIFIPHPKHPNNNNISHFPLFLSIISLNTVFRPSQISQHALQHLAFGPIVPRPRFCRAFLIQQQSFGQQLSHSCSRPVGCNRNTSTWYHSHRQPASPSTTEGRYSYISETHRLQ